MKKISLLFITGLLFLVSCKKDNGADTPPVDCGRLETAIFTEDVAETGNQVNRIIAHLPQKKYNAANLSLLVQQLAACNINAEMLCFDCIKTMPSQTEISVRLNIGGVIVQKTIDISYTASKTMIFLNLH